MESKFVIFGLACATFAFCVTVDKLIQDRKHAATAARLGCQPPPRLRHRVPFGLDIIYELFRADRKKSLNTTAIFTIDPNNLQAILSTQFQDFSLGTTRRANFMPFLGHGIFTEDGDEWKQSRAMLRPHFVRSQISDLRLEETHVQSMIRALPLDASGWTAQDDLQALFFQLTLDLATSFLWGKSVNSQNTVLGGDTTTSSLGGAVDVIQFGKAFDTCSKWLANRARMHDAYWLLDGKEFRKSCKITRRFVDHFVETAMREGS
ncbi:hypothetical protein MMC22_005773 [Lobaria immixta]|nr:hypothetical protein [Lobaria immixta]